jgi:hypothetical protein
MCVKRLNVVCNTEICKTISPKKSLLQSSGIFWRIFGSLQNKKREDVFMQKMFFFGKSFARIKKLQKKKILLPSSQILYRVQEIYF